MDDLIAEALQLANPAPATVSPLALVAHLVELGEGSVVHPFAIVGHLPSGSRALVRQPDRVPATAFIGARTIISPHAVIYTDVDIGEDCLIGDGASIREGTRIGARCSIGRHATIMHDVWLGDDVHIHDGAHITGECWIGAGCFFGPGVITSNDRNVDLVDYRYRGCAPPHFGKRVMVGSGANILAGVSVGDDAVIGIGAVVVDDVPAGARVLGQKAAVR